MRSDLILKWIFWVSYNTAILIESNNYNLDILLHFQLGVAALIARGIHHL